MFDKMLNKGLAVIPDTQKYLNRPYLEALLKESIQKPLVTVIAGAGYGKTQAVSALFKDYAADIIWLQISTGDNLISRVWEHFISAIPVQYKVLVEKLRVLGFPNTVADFQKFLSLLVKEMRPNKKLVIILDDFHLIRETSILQFIEKIVLECITGLTVILISRNEPSFNPGGLLSRGLLFRITEEDLRFKKHEVDAYFHMQGILLSEQAKSDIYVETKGWGMAIGLLGLSLKKGVPYVSNPLPVVGREIFQFIDREIFSLISEELQGCLIILSLFDKITIEFIQELYYQNTTLVMELLEISSFVRYDAFAGTYHIHPLFLKFLSKKQEMLEADKLEKLRIRAARWYGDNEYIIDAIMQYNKAGHYDEAISVMLAYSRRCSVETADLIIEFLRTASEELYEEKPIIGVLYAKFLLNNFRVEESYRIILKIKATYEVLPPTKENKAILGEAYIVLGLLSFITSFITRTYEFKEYFKMASECLPSGSIVVDRELHLNGGNYVCYVSHPGEGEFERVQEAMLYAMPYASKVMNGCGYGLEYLFLTEKAYFQRDLNNSEKNAQQAIHRSREKGQSDIEHMAMFYLIRIYVDAGLYSKVSELFEQLERRVEKEEYPERYRISDIAHGWFYAKVGQTSRIANWIMNSTNESIETSPITFSLDRLVRAEGYLADRKYYELLAFLEQDPDKYGTDDFLIGRIEGKVLKSIALYQTSEKEKAIIMLQDAYNLAYANLLVTPFIEHGSDMCDIIKCAMNDKNCTIPEVWLKDIYMKSSTYAKRLANVVTGYKIANRSMTQSAPELTKREIEILTELSHGLTREEIACESNLPVSTVKSILQNIYMKLGAVNSLDAVHIATLMNLII